MEGLTTIADSITAAAYAAARLRHEPEDVQKHADAILAAARELHRLAADLRPILERRETREQPTPRELDELLARLARVERELGIDGERDEPALLERSAGEAHSRG